MSNNEDDTITDLWPYQENEMVDRAFEAMRARRDRQIVLCLIALLSDARADLSVCSE